MDTIVGLSTALSESAVNIIRISGEESLNIVRKIFSNSKSLNPNEIIYGFIKHEDKIIDEVLVSFMKSPKSYTGEDVVEINCHGGTFLTNKILNLVIEMGATLAESGEFTKRAFLNGKIDLTKAEATMDLISAKSDIELQCAISQKRGKLYEKLEYIKEKLINNLSKIEVVIDFEDEVEDVHKNDIINDILEIRDEVEKILKYKDQGLLIKNGINTCIVGKPNVGKSSLLNYLCSSKKALVTNLPGTTRDIIEESVNFGKVTLNLSDTAGIRNSEDLIENMGIEMAKDRIKDSDLIFFVLDITRNLEKEDFEIYELIKDKDVFILLNKSEGNRVFSDKDVVDNFKIKDDKKIFNISVVEKLGFDKLADSIEEKFLFNSEKSSVNSIVLTNMRHIEAFISILKSLNDAINSINNDMQLDIVSIDMRKALTFIMNITGEDASESVINNIFSKFCIGK